MTVSRNRSQDNRRRMEAKTPKAKVIIPEQRAERVNGDPFAWCNQLLRTVCELRRELEMIEHLPENLSDFDLYLLTMINATSCLVSSSLDLRNDLILAAHQGAIDTACGPLVAHTDVHVIMKRSARLHTDPAGWIDDVLRRACDIQADADAITDDSKIGAHKQTISCEAGDLISGALDFYNNLLVGVYEGKAPSLCYPRAKGGAA